MPQKQGVDRFATYHSQPKVSIGLLPEGAIVAWGLLRLQTQRNAEWARRLNNRRLGLLRQLQ